jgi:hypothetical protein
MRVLYDVIHEGQRHRVIQHQGMQVLLLGADALQSWGGSVPPPGAAYFREIAEAVPAAAASVLLFGVAGGTVGRLLRAAGWEGTLHGVEPSAVMRDLGRRFFATDDHFDAVFEDTTEPRLASPYDVVIDDAYIGTMKVPVRPERFVRPGGLLIMNDLRSGKNTITTKIL